MLFISQVPALFEKMEMSLYTTGNQTRKTECAKRLEFLHDYPARNGIIQMIKLPRVEIDKGRLSLFV